MRNIFILIFLVIVGISFVAFIFRDSKIQDHAGGNLLQTIDSPQPTDNVVAENSSPLSIKTLKQKSYLGSAITIEQTLTAGSSYNRFLVSYQSEGLKIYGLLTVPKGERPTNGWPVILFNHGYIQPSQYSTQNSYASYVQSLAAAGFIIFKPDYRGNGNSKGTPTQVYVSPDYVTDSMNALASIKKYPDANPDKIGIWAHSMGGNITLHQLVISQDIKAAVIWGGIVGSYSDILTWWNERVATKVLTTQNDLDTADLVKQFVNEHQTPQTNPDFWNAIDPTNFIADINAPVQIDVGTKDATVPIEFSQSFRDKLQTAGKIVDYREYPGADHFLTPNYNAAMSTSISFFNKYLK